MRWLLLSIVLLDSIVFAAPPKDLVKAELLADVQSIKPGQPFKVALVLTMIPGWHVYWLNPGDGGLPTRATLELPAGLTATPFAFPTPSTFDLLGGLTAYGYEDRAILLTTVTPDASFSSNAVITCKASWLVCKDVCVAGKAAPTLTLPAGDGSADHRELFDSATARLPVEAGSAADIGEISDDFELAADGKTGTLAVAIRWKQAKPDKIAFFPPPAPGINFAKPKVNSEPTRTTITTSFELLAGQKPPLGAVDSVISWQLGDKTTGVKLPIHFESHTQTIK